MRVRRPNPRRSRITSPKRASPSLAIEYWGKAGDLALHRSAFKEAIAHLGKAIEMAEALAGAGRRRRRASNCRLQVSYGNAMIAAHGHGAPETVAAFTRAHELGAGAADMYARFSTNYGLWAGSYVHGDLTAMREPAQAFLRDVESQPGSPEAGVAHRAYGVTQWFAGDFIEARSHLEQALAIFDPERDRDLAFRFGQDVGVSAMVYLAIVLWPLGEVDRARELVDATATRIAELGHLATSTYGLMHSAMFEIIGRNVDRAAPLAKALSSVAHEHGIALWIGFGAFLEAWVELRSGSPEIGLLKMRRAAALLQQDGVGAFQPLVKTALAEAEARTGETEAALATLEQALKDFDRTGQRWFDAEIHRMHGEILLEKNPANPAPAEDAFLTAIALAQAQKARSFELRAALSLAKLYRATGRDADAHAVLGPALGGFRRRQSFRRSRRHWKSWPRSSPVRDGNPSGRYNPFECSGIPTSCDLHRRDRQCPPRAVVCFTQGAGVAGRFGERVNSTRSLIAAARRGSSRLRKERSFHEGSERVIYKRDPIRSPCLIKWVRRSPARRARPTAPCRALAWGRAPGIPHPPRRQFHKAGGIFRSQKGSTMRVEGRRMRGWRDGLPQSWLPMWLATAASWARMRSGTLARLKTCRREAG